MQTITKDTTELKAEHCQCIKDIDGALSQLQDALEAEKLFRQRVHRDEPEFDANLPALKFPIVLSTNQSKPFDHITKWRIWATGCGLLEKGA